MTMLHLTKTELEKLQAFVGETNPHIANVIEAISFPTVNSRMKSVIAVAQITAFASQFRRNIALWDEATEVPINAISFVITGSGVGKDSSVKAARKCFSTGYELIYDHSKEAAKRIAIQKAQEAGETSPSDYAVYKDYLPPIPPVDIMPTTGPGLVQHINDIGALGVGAGFMYTG